MVLLGLLSDIKHIEKNKSERFESRFSTVKICKNNSIMLQNMEDLVMGIWVAHGEGKITTNTNAVMQYVDHTHNPTNTYPLNPNDSYMGTAGLVSNNGRHLALMPHPERCFLNWQLPYMPLTFHNKYSPWFIMFKNAFNWCKSTNLDYIT